MKKSYNKAFTLVELLAVIVILAIILVIAVPKIMSVITDSKKASLETSAKMIASSAEKIKLQKELLGEEVTNMECSEVAKTTTDYESCIIDFDGSTAHVSIVGANKFSGLSVCNATKNNATIQNDKCTTNSKYFSYEFLNGEDELILYAEVKDESKCTAYLNKIYPNTDDCPTCEEENAQICNGTYDEYTLQDAITDGDIRQLDYEEAGISLSNVNISITGYNIKGGLDVVIPSTLDGYTVIEIANDAFKNKGLTIVEIPNTVTTIGKSAFFFNNITDITIPNSVTSIGDSVFYKNSLKKVYLENPNIECTCAFGNIDSDLFIELNLPRSCGCLPA